MPEDPFDKILQQINDDIIDIMLAELHSREAMIDRLIDLANLVREVREEVRSHV